MALVPHPNDSDGTPMILMAFVWSKPSRTKF